MIAIPIGLISWAMAADTFWQIYFALESRTYDATVISVGEFNRRGSHVTYEKYQLQLVWTDEHGSKQTGETATDRSQLIRTGDTVRIQYAARSGLIRSAKNQSLIGPMLLIVSFGRIGFLHLPRLCS